MKQAVLKNFDLTWLPMTGLVIFVVMFALYALWAWKKSNIPLFEHAAALPLDEARPQENASHD